MILINYKVMDSVTFQAIKWEVEECDENINIHIHGLTLENKSVIVKIPDFKPYVYLELDPKIKWSPSNVEMLRVYLKKRLRDNFPVKNKLVKRAKNYYYQQGTFLWMAFNNLDGIKAIDYAVRGTINLFGVGNINLQLHEKAADPILKLFATRKVKPSGWITAKKTTKSQLLSDYCDVFSTADIEMISSYNDISPATDIDNVVNPKIVSYDIECVSGDKTGNTFPDPSKKDDQVICISATVAYEQDAEEDWKTFILVNEIGGKKCPDNLEDGSKVLHFKNEKELLLGWTAFIMEVNPDVITGYNTLSFDDNYISIRANTNLCWPKFSKLSRIASHKTDVKELQWSSSAYGEQKFNYINMSGRLHIDMLPVISKEYTTLPSYTLNYVAEHFLGDHKIDLPAKEMMQIWYRGHEDDIRKIALYCNKDALLPLRLMKYLTTWINLVEMSKVMMVPIFDIFTRGQQWRMFSQVYCLAYDLQVVCTKKWADYQPTDSEKQFVGATVQNPKTGYWELVATYDFTSLYPTTIIAHNLCFSTFVPEYENPPEDQYHDLQWEDHSGCVHDTAIRKTKVKKEKIICGKHHYRFYKAEVKKGIIPMLLENLLAARKNTRDEQKIILARLKNESEKLTKQDVKYWKKHYDILEKRQIGYKTAANSMYGGFGSDFSYTPFYPAAASTTAMGRKHIQRAIDFANDYRKDTVLVYGDTDSCMLHFTKIKTISECFTVCREMEKAINKIFPKPMHLELEKIYLKYFLLSKKRYIGYIGDENGSIKSVDKKGVVLKRRDNCDYLKEVYKHLIDMIMEKQPRWKIFNYLRMMIDDLLSGNVDIEKLVITKSIKDNYKAKNLPHVAVAQKMRERGKYVVSGTRVRYVFVKTTGKKDPQYVKAEDPDYYLENQGVVAIDYLYYFEKQLVNPIDEALFVYFGVANVLKNLFKLVKRDVVKNASDYFMPKFKIVE